jgi:hypothetical protein
LVVWGTFLYLTFFTVYITTTLFYYYLNKRTHYNTFFSSSVFPINYLNFTSHQSYFSITQKKIPPPIWGEGQFQIGPLSIIQTSLFAMEFVHQIIVEFRSQKSNTQTNSKGLSMVIKLLHFFVCFLIPRLRDKISPKPTTKWQVALDKIHFYFKVQSHINYSITPPPINSIYCYLTPSI